MPVFEYTSNSEYGNKSFSDEWRIDETSKGDLIGIISNTLNPQGISRYNTTELNHSDVEKAFHKLDKMEESRKDLYIAETNDLETSLEGHRGLSTESAPPLVRPNNSSTAVQDISSNNPEISLRFYDRNNLSKDGWMKDPVSNSKGVWEHDVRGQLSDNYEEIVGGPARYEFLVPQNLEYEPEELPLTALNMLSHITASTGDYEDQMSDIIDENAVSGLEWVSKDRSRNNQGLINEIAGEEQVIGVQGAIIPDSLEDTWKRGVER